MAAFDGIFRFRHRDIILKLLRHIYYLDVYIAIAKVVKERGVCISGSPASKPFNGDAGRRVSPAGAERCCRIPSG